MSTPAPLHATRPAGGRLKRPGDDRRPPLARLTIVELRKMVDTRSGFWVTVGVAAVTVIFAFVNGLDHGGRDATYIQVFHDAAQPSAYLLPLLGVLLVCSEWTQRTNLTTFTLVPARERVIAAKVTAGLVISLAALLMTVTVALIVTATLGHAASGAGTLPVSVIAQGWVNSAGWMLIGLAFGIALLTSTPAIVAYLLLPPAAGGALDALHSLSGIAPWVSVTRSFPLLTLQPLNATQWGHVATTLALWIGVPFLLGLRRVRSGDIA
jgi:ABC-2 type transport system permease protein